MDPPMHALKFSEDLIWEVIKRHNASKYCKEWEALRKTLEIYKKERCPPPVYEAVLGLMEHRKDRIEESFDALCKLRVYNISDFRFELSLTAIMYFQEGYNHLKFLNYCALLGGLSVRYAKAGHCEIPAGCSQLLGYFLNFWMYSMNFNPNSDYFELACVAQRVRRSLRIKANRKEEEMKSKTAPADCGNGQKMPEKSTKALVDKKEGFPKVPEKSKIGIELPPEKTNDKKNEKQEVVEKAKNKKEGKKEASDEKMKQQEARKPDSGHKSGDKISDKAEDGMTEKTKVSERRPQKARRGGKK